MKLLLTIFFVLIFVQINLLSQDIPFQDRVGNEIDSLEKKYFGMFPMVRGFKQAVAHKIPNDSLKFIVQYSNADSSGTIEYYLNKNEVIALNHIICDYENIDSRFYDRNKYFENFDFNKFSRTIINMKYYFTDFKSHRIYLFNGDVVNGAIIWSDSLNIIVSRTENEPKYYDFQDHSKLLIINSKDIKRINYFFPNVIMGSDYHWKKWRDANADFSLFIEGIRPYSIEFDKYLKSISNYLQKNVERIETNKKLYNYYFFHPFIELTYSPYISMGGESRQIAYKWKDEKESKWQYYQKFITIRSPKLFEFIPTVGLRLNKYFSIKASYHFADERELTDDNQINYYWDSYNLSVQGYLIPERMSETEPFGNLVFGGSFGINFQNVTTNYKTTGFKIFYSNDYFPDIETTTKEKLLCYTANVFGMMNLTNNISLISSLDYTLSPKIGFQEFKQRAEYHLRPGTFMNVQLEDKKINNSFLTFNLTVRYSF